MPKNKKYMGNRYIEVRPVSESQFKDIKAEHRKEEEKLKKSSENFYDSLRYNGQPNNNNRGGYENDYQGNLFSEKEISESIKYAIRIRGLPFSFEIYDLEKLFSNYRPVRRSAKIGHYYDGGNRRKSG